MGGTSAGGKRVETRKTSGGPGSEGESLTHGACAAPGQDRSRGLPAVRAGPADPAKHAHGPDILSTVHRGCLLLLNLEKAK